MIRTHLYKRLYKAYLGCLAWLGRHRPNHHIPDKLQLPREVDPEFEVADRSATRYGDHYRGACVLVGTLGILVVFVAITPTALQIESKEWLILLGVLKFLLMVGILLLVNPLGGIPKISKSWIISRRRAEELRYVPLKRLKEELSQSEESSRGSKQLRDELAYILNGPEGQIAYNFSRAAAYKAIEHFSEKLSWRGFALAMVCALLILLSELHWAPHFPGLIYGTVALPAFVAGVHGINGALKIASLAEEHEEMGKLLQSLYVELKSTDVADTKAILAIAERTYSQLVSRDVLWGESTEKSANIKPA
jgi:hypothetical protein